MPVELFRYRGAANDGGTLEYIFESDEHVPKTVSKEKAAEIAADFVTTFEDLEKVRKSDKAQAKNPCHMLRAALGNARHYLSEIQDSLKN